LGGDSSNGKKMVQRVMLLNWLQPAPDWFNLLLSYQAGDGRLSLRFNSLMMPCSIGRLLSMPRI
jgi:hypothetical protein